MRYKAKVLGKEMEVEGFHCQDDKFDYIITAIGSQKSIIQEHLASGMTIYPVDAKTLQPIDIWTNTDIALPKALTPVQREFIY